MTSVPRRPVVIDTNVLIAANDDANSGPECVGACVAAIKDIYSDGQVVLDEGGRILSEYKRHLRADRQPGVGHAFLKWLFLSLGYPDRCSHVRVTLIDENPETYRDLAFEGELANFDPADRKFVVVAAVHPDSPPILEATDTDWWIHRDALRDVGVVINFVCEDEIRRRCETRHP